MKMSQEIQKQMLHQILARCWTDAAFKARLLADPVAVLQAEGVRVPAGVQLRVLENTAQVAYLVIPSRPADLSDQVLNDVVGGGDVIAPLASSPGRDPMKKHMAAIWMAKYFPNPWA